MWIIGRSFWSSFFDFGGAACEGVLPAPGKGNAGGAPAPPCCNAAINAAMGSSPGGGAEDPATEEATAVVDDAVDEARGRCCSETGPIPGKRPDAAALSIAFMNCCCCSSDQTEGSGAEAAMPAAWRGDVWVGGAPLTLRDPGVDAGGVGISVVSPTKSVKPVRLGMDGVTSQHAIRVRPGTRKEGVEGRTIFHVCCSVLATAGGGDAGETVTSASKNGLPAGFCPCRWRVGHGG